MMRRDGRFPFPLAEGREVGGASGGAEAAAGARSAAMGTRGLKEAVVELQPGQAPGAEASGTGDASDSRDWGPSAGGEGGAGWGMGAVGRWCSSRCLTVPGGQGRTLPFSPWKQQQLRLSRREARFHVP